MEKKNKVILKYWIDVALLLYCFIILFCIVKFTPDAVCFGCASFYFGVTTGLTLALAYLLFFSIFTPIVKYIIARVRKKNISFMDILINK
jgi:hypothetical protein